MASTSGQTGHEAAGTAEEASSAPKDPIATETPPKPSKIKQYWAKVGLDVGTVLIMAKAALPPIIATAMYQSTPVANLYGNLGYLLAVISFLSLCIMPRAKYIETLVLNTLAIAIAGAVSLLLGYCASQARKHTANPNDKPPAGAAIKVPYNSSASAVCAIWLFFLTFLSNSLRAYFPQVTFPVIMFSIFTIVSATNSPHLPNMAAQITLVKTLLTTFTSGLALATGVSLFVVPITSRNVAFKEIAGYIGLLKKTLGVQTAYLKSLETTDIFGPSPESSSEEHEKKKHKRHHKSKKNSPQEQSPEVTALKESISALTALHGKLYGDLPYAKRDIGYGRLDAKDLDQISKLLRRILLPIIGMSTISDIFKRVADRISREEEEDSVVKVGSKKARYQHEWTEIMKALRSPFQTVSNAMQEGLSHALIILELTPRPKTNQNQKKGSQSSDVEADAVPKPGDKEFTAWMQKRLREFYESRGVAIQKWRDERGVDAPSDSNSRISYETASRNQLWMLLYMEHLLYATALAISELLEYVEGRMSDPKLQHKRFIFPGKGRIKKWIKGAFRTGDSDIDHRNLDELEVGAPSVSLGESYGKDRDLEHLPPSNLWEKIGDKLRLIPQFFGSSAAAYGFRAACATLSIGIIAYLRVTAVFFIEQRLIWAMIMVAIGMSLTAGASIFGFLGRIFGSLIAMIMAYIVWYIVNGKTPGVIVFLYINLCFGTYFLVKHPRFVIISILASVTSILIIGYELEYRKIGAVKATSNGQPYYPTYLLAPYRLACVIGGMTVAFFWTLFPYPVTARSQLRESLGSCLYLLANYYSCIHTTVRIRITGVEGDLTDKRNPARQLEKHRTKVFSKCIMLVRSLREHSAFTKWEPALGGKFPKEEYDHIINHTENILHYIALIGYATSLFVESENKERKWLDDLAGMTKEVDITTTEITSMLSLLSSSVINGQKLPPYLRAPRPYELSMRLEAIDKDILSANHVLEPGYSAFAVMQVSSMLIHDDLCKLIERVKKLVGVVDFSFQVVSTTSSESTSQETLWKPVSSEKGKSE